MIAIVDYNMGNLQSVKNAFNLYSKNVDIVSDPDKLKDYDKLVLPGVGAYGDAMKHLKENSLDEAIKEFANSGKPLLGVCLGMQLLLENGTEFGTCDGLSLIPGTVVKFDKTKFSTPHKVPHMGWNKLFLQQENQIVKDLSSESYLYFVHSYHVECDDRYVLAKTSYGYEFPSAIVRDNIVGFQPHPEKSHDNGLKIIKNFTKS
ncbi:MAG TPA: imidazole glycerol phosphate synthase subunit HisH [Campylobacterales bacterium]|nr:imidazole glycerol phosphate synthase subunit HisH [Campylobacterales bacterium]